MSIYTPEIAVNRFGLGAKSGDLAEAKQGPQEWLLTQTASLTLTAGLSESKASIASVRDYRAVKKQQEALTDKKQNISTMSMKAEQPMSASMSPKMNVKETATASDDPIKKMRRQANQNAMRLAINTLQHQIETHDGFQGRLLDFFSNHFSVTGTNFNMRSLAPTLEREAIAPHLGGQFSEMLIAVEQHPAMLVYLNNEQSIGPQSRVGLKRQQRGLNENLAREILELHTLGVDGGYVQEDVKELAKAITGWTVSLKEKEAGFIFRRGTHEPGKRKLLGVLYQEGGVRQGETILRDLAKHPSTARYMSFKLARHFIADQPSQVLVDVMTQRWLATDGYLPEVLAVMVKHKESWQPDLQKIKTPREFLLSACRACGSGFLSTQQLFDSLLIMGQSPFSAGSPAGFGDTASTWNGAEALMSRIEWADQYAAKIKLKQPIDDIALAALGQHLNRDTQLMVQRAESRQQSLALLLMSPEFQRR